MNSDSIHKRLQFIENSGIYHSVNVKKSLKAGDSRRGGGAAPVAAGNSVSGGIRQALEDGLDGAIETRQRFAEMTNQG